MDQLELQDIQIRYGDGPTIIDGLDLNVRQGSFCAIVGPSGSGKTSVLNAIAGFVRPQRGRIRVAGSDVIDVRPEARNIGVVFQDYALFPHLTVANNVAYGLRVRRVPKEEIRSEVAKYLDLVGLSGYENRYPDQLSGGQKQRVALARALVVKPDILLLDEPLSALDRKIRKEMQIELRRIQRETGVTAVIVTHDQDEAISLGDDLVVLEAGAIMQRGRPAEVYGSPQNYFVADFLGELNVVRCVAVDGTTVTVGGVATTVRDIETAVSDGDEAFLVFRPEHAVVAPTRANEQFNGLEIDGTVAEIIDQGQTHDIFVDTAFGTVKSTQLSSTPDPVRVGDQAYVRMTAGALTVFGISEKGRL